MTQPKTIEAFLESLERALRLSGRHRRRVIEEARDHLIEARERGIAAGLDPQAAENAAIAAFGDPGVVASRFNPGLLARLSSEVDRFDRWRAVHPTAGYIVELSPVTLVVAALWSPMVALCVLPGWAVYAWLGRQLRGRQEPGYRNRLWGWKQEHPTAYQLATNGAALLGATTYVALEWLAGSPHPKTLWLFVFLLLFIPVGLILNAPKRYQPPATPAG